MNIITISREFGSGGRELGKRLADELNIAYYDKEIIGMIGEKLALDETYIANVLERGLTRQYPYTFRRTFSFTQPQNPYASLLAEQSRIVRELAAKEDCVIVGRGADVLLKEQRPFNIFVYADMEAKLARCRERAGEDERLSDRGLEKRIRQVDQNRASGYGLISGRHWGERGNYHLCVNTTGLSVPAIVPHVAAFARLWFEG